MSENDEPVVFYNSDGTPAVPPQKLRPPVYAWMNGAVADVSDVFNIVSQCFRVCPWCSEEGWDFATRECRTCGTRDVELKELRLQLRERLEAGGIADSPEMRRGLLRWHRAREKERVRTAHACCVCGTRDDAKLHVHFGVPYCIRHWPEPSASAVSAPKAIPRRPPHDTPSWPEHVSTPGWED